MTLQLQQEQKLRIILQRPTAAWRLIRCASFTSSRLRYQTRSSPIAVFLVLFSFAFAGHADGGSSQQANTATDQASQTLQGKVEYVDLEGGYYQLISTEGLKLRPVNFHKWPDCQKHGTIVSGVFKYRPAGRSFFMDNASPVELLELACKETVGTTK